MKDNIPGIPNHYVSKTGEVYRKDRYYNTISGTYFSKRGGKWKKLNIQIFKARKGSYEYSRVHICTQTNTGIINRLIKVSRLVALAYIPNPNNYPIVMHKDNKRTHNVVSNLMWGTPKMNMAQMAKDGRSTRKYKFSKRQYRRLVRLREQGWTLQRLGEKFGVSFSVVYRVLRSNYFGE